MQPAYNIPLSNKELKWLGELCAIQGQIEMLMSNTVMHLLDVSYDVANTILRPTSARVNAKVWISIVRCKSSSQNFLKKAENIYSTMPDVFKDRNIVVHGLYGHESDKGFYALYGDGVVNDDPVVAVRRGDQSRHSVDKIKEARDSAARLSRELHELIVPLIEVPVAPSRPSD